jgi:hypothetical protein
LAQAHKTPLAQHLVSQFALLSQLSQYLLWLLVPNAYVLQYQKLQLYLIQIRLYVVLMMLRVLFVPLLSPKCQRLNVNSGFAIHTQRLTLVTFLRF